jgi:hypothetical protein
VIISGSMSKGCLAEDGDIDYFIITRAGRLWIARTLAGRCTRKLVLFNSHRDFCVNYFIDDGTPCHRGSQPFTATEVLTLLPTYGQRQSRPTSSRHNTWAYAMLPGHAPDPGFLRPTAAGSSNSAWNACWAGVRGGGWSNG